MMKKVMCLAVIAVLCVGTSAYADITLELRLVDDVGSAAPTIANDEEVELHLQGRLLGDPSEGLALWGANLSAIAAGTVPPNADLCDTSGFVIVAPVADYEFDRNLGLTNPASLIGQTGYSGTCDGTDLLQLGGGQNTIGNDDPPAYPTGTVLFGVGNSDWEDLGVGYYVPNVDDDGTVTLTLDTGFANVIDVGEVDQCVVAAYIVSGVDTDTMAGMVITVTGGLPPCAATDVNCDGTTNAGDLLVIKNPANWLQTVPPSTCVRCDVNGDTLINAGDLLVIKNPANWLTSPGPCTGVGCP